MQLLKRIRFKKDNIVRILRSLPGKGKVNAQTGQEVIPDEIIGTSSISSGFRIINIASLLGVEPSSIEKYLQRQIGQKIYRGELLALRAGGLFKSKKIVVAPTDGTVDFINPRNGEVKLSFLPKRINLPSAVYGIVEFVDHVHSQVLIKTQVTVIYGVFGSGRSREGILHVQDLRSDLIDSRSISIKDAEHVIVGRNLIYKDAISAAISSNVSGIITGGIDARDYKGMAGGNLSFPKKFDNDIGISVVVCEGFGSVPIAQDIFDILSKHDQKFVIIDGNKATISLPSDKSDCMIAIRRTALPPTLETDLKGEVTTPVSVEDIKVGVNVRVIGTTFLGEQGKIISIDKTKTRLASGLYSQLATIETKLRKIQIPMTNLELI